MKDTKPELNQDEMDAIAKKLNLEFEDNRNNQFDGSDDEKPYRKRGNRQKFEKAFSANEHGSPISGNFLTMIGFGTYVVGFIGGVIFGAVTGPHEFNWLSTLYIWLTSFVTGTIFLGFGDIIELLSSILEQLLDLKQSKK
jgi:hypothetical protein